MGDAAAAINYFEESVEFLTKLPADDLEVTTQTFLAMLPYIFINEAAMIIIFEHTFCRSHIHYLFHLTKSVT